MYRDLTFENRRVCFSFEFHRVYYGILDVILQMIWLGISKAKTDCETHMVVLKIPLGKLTSY